MAGVQRSHRWHQPDDAAIGSRLPRLFFHPRCVRLIRAMQAYRYAPGSEVPGSVMAA
jgi:hypothetical protein